VPSRLARGPPGLDRLVDLDLSMITIDLSPRTAGSFDLR